MPRLTNRDLICINLIAQQGVVRLDTIQLHLQSLGMKIDGRSLRHLSVRWVEMGLVNKERLLANCPSIIWPTSGAIKLANLPKIKNERFGRPSYSNLLHDLAVSRVRVEYQFHNAKWTCERILKNTFQSEHLADGLAIIDKTKILVEVDRTAKDPQRLLEIMRSHALHPEITAVDYWTTDELFQFISSRAAQINKEVRNETVRTFLLPKEVNL